MDQNFWKKCSSCKKEISFSTKYYECSVSTCVGERKGYVFCSVPCWEVHLPTARHKDAAAIEMKAPATGIAAKETGPARRIVRPAGSGPAPTAPVEREILVVVSKLKKFIKDASDMNTSDNVAEWLSDKIRALALEAVEKARQEGRKTVMERDFR
jgi:histone H3/H4